MQTPEVIVELVATKHWKLERQEWRTKLVEELVAAGYEMDEAMDGWVEEMTDERDRSRAVAAEQEEEAQIAAERDARILEREMERDTERKFVRYRD